MKYTSGHEVYQDFGDKAFTVRIGGFIGLAVELEGVDGHTDLLICLPAVPKKLFEIDNESV